MSRARVAALAAAIVLVGIHLVLVAEVRMGGAPLMTIDKES